MSFHCVLILKISIEQFAINLIIALLKLLWFLPLGYFKIFNLVSSSFIMLYLRVVFFILILPEVQKISVLLDSVDCYLSSAWKIFGYYPFKYCFCFFSSPMTPIICILNEMTVHISLILYCSLNSFFPCDSAYTFSH